MDVALNFLSNIDKHLPPCGLNDQDQTSYQIVGKVERGVVEERSSCDEGEP